MVIGIIYSNDVISYYLHCLCSKGLIKARNEQNDLILIFIRTFSYPTGLPTIRVSCEKVHANNEQNKNIGEITIALDDGISNQKGFNQMIKFKLILINVKLPR